MEYSCTTPVLLLFFNRPRHAEAVLERLRSVRPKQVYVHGDGPRPQVAGEVEKVAEVRAMVGQIDWPCEVKTLFREQNAGLRAGVSGALDWFFGEVDRGIVLEDDCLPDHSFFQFCEEMLERYANNSQVMHIGGSNVAQGLTQSFADSYFFSKFTFVWGWASWSRAWAKMSLTLDGLEAFEGNDELAHVLKNPMARTYLYDKFRVTKLGLNSSWAYAWFYSILKNNGLSVVPRVNLVQNTGIGDPEATHTKKRDPQAEVRASRMPFPILHPKSMGFDPILEQALFYAAQKSRIRLILWFLLQKFGLR